MPATPQQDMNEAARLTREGRLSEATALIQRLLRGEQAAPASLNAGGNGPFTIQ